jgi:diaminopimelate epimerase
VSALRFTKMSGAGNDFVVLDRPAWESIPGARIAWVRGVARRGVSVGSDGVLVVDPPEGSRVRVTFLNPDGAEAFCGNGSRCAARFAHERLGAPASMTLATAAGEVRAVVAGGRVSLTLAAPEDGGALDLEASGRPVHARLIRAGVPHLVVRVDDVSAFPLASLGPTLRRHPALGPGGANVTIVAAEGDSRIHVRTWERGVENETLACGSGAIAAAFACRLDGGAASLEVVPASGLALRVTLDGDAAAPSAAHLAGDARFVFDGVLSAEGIASRG